MKTKNNVQKAITKSMAVIISLVLISITVNAQDFWRTVMENNSLSQIAMAMTDNAEASSSSAYASAADLSAYANVEAEETLEVESWMLAENNFFTTVNIATEVEDALEVENWMTNENLFDGMASYFKVDTEETLQVEDWMQDSNYFGVISVDVEEETEADLEVEAWMTNPKNWNI